MAKFEFSLTGLSVKYEGDVIDVKAVSAAVQQNVGALVETAMGPNLAQTNSAPKTLDVEAEEVTTKKAPRKARNRGPKMRKSNDYQLVVNHPMYGSPTQAMTVIEKALYTLYLAKEQNLADGMSPSSISKTFNAAYATAGPISPSNVSRDTKPVCGGKEAQLSLQSGDEGCYYILTDTGIARAKALVDSVKPNP